jgi:hypothetical protein
MDGLKYNRNLYLCNELILENIDYNNYNNYINCIDDINKYMSETPRELFYDGLYCLCYIKLLFNTNNINNTTNFDMFGYQRAKRRIKNNINVTHIINEIMKIVIRLETRINPFFNERNFSHLGIIKILKEQIRKDIIDILWNNYGRYLYNSDILNHWPYDISYYIMNIMINNL